MASVPNCSASTSTTSGGGRRRSSSCSTQANASRWSPMPERRRSAIRALRWCAPWATQGSLWYPCPDPARSSPRFRPLGSTRRRGCSSVFCRRQPRRGALEPLAALPYALVFYEAPHRIKAALAALAATLGAAREIVIARELTKRFETIHRCLLGDASAWIEADPDRQRGEFVLIVGAPAAAAAEAEDAHDATLALLLAELPLARAVKLAVALTRAPKNRLYERALALKQTLKPPPR